MLQLTPQVLLDILNQNRYQAEIQEESQQVYTILKIKGKEYPLFLRIFEEGNLLQILVFIPSYLTLDEFQEASLPQNLKKRSKQEIISDMARLLHLLNKELDVPGFGMDEKAGIVFYRLMLPIFKKKVDEEIFMSFIKTAENVCRIFTNPIEAVSLGQMSLDEILEKIDHNHT